MKQHKRVFWLLVGNKNTGSSRIHGYNVHKALLAKGIRSKILKQGTAKFSRKEKIKILLSLKKGDLLVLQKRKELYLKNILRLLKFKGVSIAFIDCDLPVCDPLLTKYFDYIICTSKKLTKLYAEKYPEKKIAYVPDAVEYYNKKQISFEKKAIYFGWLTDSRIKKIQFLKDLFKQYDWDVFSMSNKEKADIVWKKWYDEETFQIISNYAVSIIPIDDVNAAKYKSANRVLQSLALGNIVLCGDIEAYREVINHGENGFICSSTEDWVKALSCITEDSKREQIIEKGYETAKKYSIDKIILLWISFLNLQND